MKEGTNPPDQIGQERVETLLRAVKLMYGHRQFYDQFGRSRPEKDVIALFKERIITPSSNQITNYETHGLAHIVVEIPYPSVLTTDIIDLSLFSLDTPPRYAWIKSQQTESLTIIVSSGKQPAPEKTIKLEKEVLGIYLKTYYHSNRHRQIPYEIELEPLYIHLS